ncbi:MAG TPA: nucleotidyltransferase family protein [Bryobacteraceae bacterium]|nr:nucleotidyltransferase family protein [Bryobacteraceae bacterium]
MKPSGVILAAGLSRRMGFPKALLRWDGETYLDRLIRLFGLACADVTVVLRPGGEERLGECARLRECRVVFNPDAERGQLSSLQTGLAAVPEAGAVLFSPVDYAHVQEETVRLAAAGGEEMIVQPSYRGEHGHPVWVRRAVADALLAVPADGAARDVVRRYRRRFIEVDDAGVVMDADDPAAYAAVREKLR